ncbi:prothoracicotropic hormone isoform X2 [Haematobia irritans]|uniref:prothoracicotropic hormone isoform X2 n=1 Tax=Haematobia irritans TaxID=7368 RepID=UPI003F50B4FF
MPWTTLLCVTVLISVVFGNRLMDNHFMRSSSSSSSYVRPYKKISPKDDFLDVLSSKFKDDSQDIPTPEDEFYEKSTQKSQRLMCKENWLDFIKPQNNFINCETNAMQGDSRELHEDLLGKPNRPAKQLQPYGKTKSLVNDIMDTEDIDDHALGNAMMGPSISTLPEANFKEFYNDLILDADKEIAMKRNGNAIGTPLGTAPTRGCDCKNDLVDLGQQHFPRYLLNAVCQTNDMGSKCWSGSLCRPLEYKVKVLTFRTILDNVQKDLTLAWLPDDLRQIWKFKTVTVTAGCFCS